MKEEKEGKQGMLALSSLFSPVHLPKVDYHELRDGELLFS